MLDFNDHMMILEPKMIWFVIEVQQLLLAYKACVLCLEIGKDFHTG